MTQNVSWLAIDSNGGNSSYLELKHRLVVANGWGDLDLTHLIEFAKNEDWETFQAEFQILYSRIYSEVEDASGVAKIFWNLLHIKAGDIVVGIEGTKVMGIGEAQMDAVGSYRHDKFHEYGNTVLYGFSWHDWSEVSPDFTPTAPALSVKGIANLQNERDQVLAVWNSFKAN